MTRTTYGAAYRSEADARSALESFCAAGEISEGEHPKLIRRVMRLSAGVRSGYFIEIDD